MSKPKIIAVYGKKPRASKTSKHVVVCGAKFFYQLSKQDTPFGLVVWTGDPPYIKVAPVKTRKGFTAFESANQWISENMNKITAKANDPSNLYFDKDTVEAMNAKLKKEGKKV